MAYQVKFSRVPCQIRTGLLVLLGIVSGLTIAEQIDANRPSCKTPLSDEYYFPARFFDGSEQTDRHIRRWYSKHLRAMSEQSLTCTPVPDEMYRFLWLRTWGKPISVSVWRVGEKAVLHAVQLTGYGGFDPGEVERKVQLELSASQWQELSNDLAAMEYWAMPVRVRTLGADGARWIVEGSKGARYHIVDRWAIREGALRGFCLKLIDLAGLRPAGDDQRRYGIY